MIPLISAQLSRPYRFFPSLAGASLLRFSVPGANPNDTRFIRPCPSYVARRDASSRVIYASTINQVDWKNSYDFVHRLTRTVLGSPVWRIVRQVLPRRELAPGAHVHPGRVRDAWYAGLAGHVARETVTLRGEDVVAFWWRPGLQQKSFLHELFENS